MTMVDLEYARKLNFVLRNLFLLSKKKANILTWKLVRNAKNLAEVYYKSSVNGKPVRFL